MKRITSYLVCTFVALAMIGTLTTCVPQLDEPGSGYVGNGSLSISAIVSDATVVTKTASDEALKEKDLNTLDIFVEHVTGTTGDGTFILQYHLPLSQFPDNVPTGARVIGDQVKSFLAERWRQEGLVFGEKYNIYVAANNTQTRGTKDLSTFYVTALKALVANEKTEGIAVLDNDGNIGWKDNKTSGNIYKLYDANPGDARALSSEKEFMMDGVLKNWTPVAGSKDQVFGFTSTDDNIQSNTNQALILNRAAAKFVLNVSFNEDFVKSLTQTKKTVEGQETWVDKPAKDQVFITGEPAWKFYNFAFGAPVFAPATQGAGIEVHNSGFNIFHNQSCEGGTPFTITTYSYPNKWDAADYATKAPSMVISVGFREYKNFNANGEPIITGNDNNDYITNYHYYRIPLVKSTVTEIERNHIYVINATIATKGSAIQEDQDVTENIQYAVLPWNDETNSAATQSQVESVPHYYFRVNPKVYTLRGDGEHSVTLNYSKASGTKVNWKVFTYDNEGNQTAVVAKDNTSGEWAWFYNSTGDFTTTYSDRVNNQNRPWEHMGVTITQSDEGTSGSKGTVTVTSTALTNKAIKYIRLRVYLDEEETFQSGVETMYEDIIIRHFPTDNVQNIEGNWSSYTGTTTKHTLTTTNLSQAQAWAAQYGVDYQTEQVTDVEYINYATYTANASDTEHYHISGPTETTYDVFHQMVQSSTNRRIANSQANAVADGSEGHSYYWGTDPVQVYGWPGAPDQYDYSTGSGWNTNYFKYTNYYTATYTRTSDPYTQYSVTYTTETATTWVDWETDPKNSTTATSTAKTTYDGSNFQAKVYNNNNVYPIVVGRTGNNPNYRYYYTIGDSQYANIRVNTPTQTYTQVTFSGQGLNNNHMYVIQISSTSDTYVLGRPYVNESTHQSNDNVVSPAFMIASQLGATRVFTGNDAAINAATHCSRYMEVTEDGTRYTGWRLPTQAEIGVITSYQNGTINGVTIPADYQSITAVLTGERYWCLSGQKIQTSNSEPTTEGNAYLRCVRDLTAEEVKTLNDFDAIQQQYQ